MDLNEKLKKIEEHFQKITKEELEKNLIKAGLGRIQPSSYSHMKMITEEDLAAEKNNYIYVPKKANYQFEDYPTTVYSKYEVA